MRFFVIFHKTKVVVSVIWPRLITLAETMIIPDITKTDFPLWFEENDDKHNLTQNAV